MFSDKEIIQNDGYWESAIETELHALKKKLITERDLVEKVIELKSRLVDSLIE